MTASEPAASASFFQLFEARFAAGGEDEAGAGVGERARAVAWPMPALAPVMRATFPWRLTWIIFSVGGFLRLCAGDLIVDELWCRWRGSKPSERVA